MINYLLLDALIILFPLLLSFKWKFQYYKYFKPLFASIAIVGTIYIFWDVLVTLRGDWSFNEEYVLHMGDFPLPLEEILFFIAVPYACIFIYENLVYFLDEWTVPFNRWFYITTSILLIIVGLIFFHQDYTILALSSVAAFFIIAMVIMPQLLQSGHFWLYIVISFIPFIIFNYLLTSIPIVIYNSDAIWGTQASWDGRFFTIPLEDFFYNFSMLSFYVMFYIHFKDKWSTKKNEHVEKTYK